MAVDGFALAEIGQLEKLAHFDFAVVAGMRRRRALGPLESFFAGLHLNDPVACDELLSCGEGAINHGASVVYGEFDARALGAGLETGEIEQHAGLHQLFVVLAHSGKQLFTGHDTGFGLLTGFYHHHEFHGYLSFGSSLRILRHYWVLPIRRIRDSKIDTVLEVFVEIY